MKQRWLKDWPWETVVAINAGLCKKKDVLHKPTSDGHDPARKLWESSRTRGLTLRETLDICRECHKLAPFCFYKQNMIRRNWWGEATDEPSVNATSPWS